MQAFYKIMVDGAEVENTGNLSWGDDIDTIASEFSFSSTQNIEVGAKTVIINEQTGKEVLRGLITDKSLDKNKLYQYSGFDYGFFLNKNEVIIQFNNVKIDMAIKQLCAKVNIPCGNICSINAYVTKIFKDNVVSDIIIELLEMARKKTGVKYVFSCQCGKLEIVDTMVECESVIKLTDGQQINIVDSVGDISYSESIQELKNSVQIVDSDETSVFVVASARDSASISKYGLLGQVETVDKDDKTSKNVIASNILKDANKITTTVSVEMLGTDDIKKGSILDFNYPDFNIVGKHYAKTTKHTISNNIHKLSAEYIKV